MPRVQVLKKVGRYAVGDTFEASKTDANLLATMSLVKILSDEEPKIETADVLAEDTECEEYSDLETVETRSMEGAETVPGKKERRKKKKNRYRRRDMVAE